MKLFVLNFLLVFSYDLHSQKINSSTSLSGGKSNFYSYGKSFNVFFTVGQQSPVGQLSSHRIKIRQGFLQPMGSIENFSKEKREFKVQIFPSPFSQYLNVNFKEDVSSNTNLMLFDLNGKIVYNNMLSGSRDNKIILNNLLPATYLLRLESKNKFIQTKVIKNK